MKTKFTLLVALTIAFFSAKSQVGQVPNDTFTHWSISQYAPDGWSTYESLFQTSLGLASRDTASADLAFGPGTSAVKLISDSIALAPSQGVIAGVLSLGTGGINGQTEAPYFLGSPFIYRPDTLLVLYKYSSVSTDTPTAFMYMTKPDTAILAVDAFLPIPGSPTSFTLAEIPFTGYYLSPSAPDTFLLQFTPSHVAPVKNSTLTLYLVLFGYVNLPTGLQQIADKMNFALYPNPATNVINISSAENAGGFKVLISDMSGNFVYGGALDGNKTTISTGSLASGMYICRIADASGNILEQNKFIITK